MIRLMLLSLFVFPLVTFYSFFFFHLGGKGGAGGKVQRSDLINLRIQRQYIHTSKNEEFPSYIIVVFFFPFFRESIEPVSQASTILFFFLFLFSFPLLEGAGGIR